MELTNYVREFWERILSIPQTVSPPPHMYFCEQCRMTFPKGWSDEEQAAEAAENFPGLPPEHAAVVCDDCYREIMGLPPRGETS
jgi:hypothetical protein